MIALDTSVLAFAVNRYAPEHPRAARVVEALVNGEQEWGMPSPVVHEFLRLVTHPFAIARPLEPREAVGFLQTLLASPSATVLAPTEKHLTVLAELSEAIPAHGRLSLGLETAAVLREHGVRELLSVDRGMRRFAFLTVVDPIHGPAWSPGAPPARRYRTLLTGGTRAR